MRRGQVRPQQDRNERAARQLRPPPEAPRLQARVRQAHGREDRPPLARAHTERARSVRRQPGPRRLRRELRGGGARLRRRVQGAAARRGADAAAVRWEPDVAGRHASDEWPVRSDSHGHCGSEASVARLRVHARDVSVGRRLADLGQGERQVRWRVDGSGCPVSQQ